MYSYIKGIITKIDNIFIVVENNGIGYSIMVSNPYKYKVNTETIIYIYSHVREDEYTLYGFDTEEEKDLFLKLISVKGLGPRMTLPILASSSIVGIEDAINKENILYLKKFPKIGDKLAKQIILDLKGKITENINTPINDLTETLKSLGYKNQDISKVLPNIDMTQSLELQIKNALKFLLK